MRFPKIRGPSVKVTITDDCILQSLWRPLVYGNPQHTSEPIAERAGGSIHKQRAAIFDPAIGLNKHTDTDCDMGVWGGWVEDKGMSLYRGLWGIRGYTGVY